jgi:membrane-associated protease RseP (regulator of RpoE activity)
MNKRMLGAVVLALVLPAAMVAADDRGGEGGFVRGGPRSTMRGGYAVVNDEPGLLVTGTVEDSPAEAAGLMRGDIILEVDGTEVNSVSDLRAVLAEMEAGDEVEVLISRGGREMSLDVTLETRLYRPAFGIYGGSGGPAGPGNRGPAPIGPRGSRPMPRDVDRGHGHHFEPGEMFRFMFGEEDLPADMMPGGDVVRTVEEGSPADVAGLQPGDIIVRIGDIALEDVSAGQAVQSLEPGDTVEIEVYRPGSEGEIETVTLEATLAANEDGGPYLGIAYLRFRHPMMGVWPRFPMGAPAEPNRQPSTSM